MLSMSTVSEAWGLEEAPQAMSRALDVDFLEFDGWRYVPGWCCGGFVVFKEKDWVG